MDRIKQYQGTERQLTSFTDETPGTDKTQAKKRIRLAPGRKGERETQRKQLSPLSANATEEKQHIPKTDSPITTRKTTEALQKPDSPKRVADMVSAHNPDFASDLVKHGLEIRAHLEEHIKTLPADRTCPMPGMARFVTEVTNFLETRVINDEQISDEERALYRKLSAELHSLGEENYPWNKSFMLFIKSGLFISFYYRDSDYPGKSRKRYNVFFITTTLTKIDTLPWNHFYSRKWCHNLAQLRKLALLSDDAYLHLSEYTSFFYPQLDAIDVEFINKTWFLNIHPVGFFYDTPVLEFDDVLEDVATYQIHDPYHSLRSKMPAIWSPVEHDKLNEIITFFETCKVVGRCTPRIKFHAGNIEPDFNFRLLRDNETDFPPQALHMVFFLIGHEVSQPLCVNHTNRQFNDTLKIFFEEGDVKKSLFSDLPENYLSLSRDTLRDTLLFYRYLTKSGWWYNKL